LIKEKQKECDLERSLRYLAEDKLREELVKFERERKINFSHLEDAAVQVCLKGD
jgi:hypothetical protein